MMNHGKCYGSTVMGERGQVVIPAEAREEIGIEPGEKLIVFGNKNRGVIIIFKSDVMARFADMLFKKASFFDDFFKHGHSKKNEQSMRKPEQRKAQTDSAQKENMQDEEIPE